MADDPLTAIQLLTAGTVQLQESGIAASRWEAETLLAHAAGWTRAKLYQNLSQPVTNEARQQFFKLVADRSQRMPLQYLLGSQEFMGLSFHVDERVLIPRPETELLVERVLFLLQGRKQPVVADVGTGSGAIAISLAVFHPTVKILATDLSSGALAVARANAAEHQVSERICFRQGDLLEPLKDAVGPGGFTGIVSNPPYIADQDMERLEAEVKDHEPRLALAGGSDGLDYYRRIIAEAGEYLSDGGFIALEIGYDQGDAIMDMFENTNGFFPAVLQQDYAGRDRIVWAVSRQDP